MGFLFFQLSKPGFKERLAFNQDNLPFASFAINLKLNVVFGNFQVGFFHVKELGSAQAVLPENRNDGFVAGVLCSVQDFEHFSQAEVNTAFSKKSR